VVLVLAVAAVVVVVVVGSRPEINQARALLTNHLIPPP